MKTARNAIRLLRQFSSDAPKLGVSELSRRLDLDRATVHRMLRTLLDERFIEQEAATRLYRLGRGVLELAQNFLRQHGIVGVATPHLERLRNLTGETVGLAILDGRETVCIATAESRHPVRVTYYVGERMPLHCSSSGMIFLAALAPAQRKSLLTGKLQRYSPKTVVNPAKIVEIASEVLRKGVSFSDEGYIPGVRGASAPVRGPGDEVIAVVSMVAPCQRVSMRQLTALAEQVRKAGEIISEDLAQSAITATAPDNLRRAAR